MRRPTLRLAAIIIAVVAAFAAAFILKPPTEKKTDTVASTASPILAFAPPTPNQILAQITVPAQGSPTDKALATAIEKVGKKPEVAPMWVNLGDTLAQKLRDTADQHYYDLAELTYRHALSLDPKSVDAMTGMAWVTGGRHTFDESVEWANKALAVDPNGIAAHGIIGDAALELGNYDLAYEEYQKMMDLRPDLSSWSRGSYLLWLCGDRLKAVSLMETAIRSGGRFAENTAWCRAKLAMMYFNDGALAAAAQAIEPSIKADSCNTHVLLAAAKIAAANRDFPAAISFYQKILEGGRNQEAIAAIGDIHFVQGAKDEAEKCYAEVEAIHANHVSTGVHDHTQMARFFADHDRNPTEALRLAEQHKLTTNVLEADVLAWVYFKSGDQPHAIEAIKRALARNTPSPEIHYHAGMIAAKAGDHVSARKHLGLALSLNPQFDPLQATIASRTLNELNTRPSAAAANTPPSDSEPIR